MKSKFVSLLGSLLFLCMNVGVFAQEINNGDKVYDENLVTVLFHAYGNQLQPPVIELGSDQKLELSFDDLSNQYYTFKYTFVHCTSDWKTSDLEPMDYIDGYFEGDITNYKFSFNTRTPYVHYDLVFPDNDMQPKLSGNYLLKVYLDDGSGPQIMITRRFFISESQVRIAAGMAAHPKNVSYLTKKQQIDLHVLIPNTFNDEAEQRFKINIRQNGRWDNALMGISPSSVSPGLLYFDFPDGLVFNGGNEARFFDMKSYRYLSESIARIKPEDNYYKVYLHPDWSRNGKAYETYKCIQGRELITARNDQDPMTEGDYAEVNFSLKVRKLEQGSVYIMGALTDWQFTAEAKMVYDESLQAYRGKLFLKQGYYEYWYVVVPPGAKKGEIVPYEGNHWETHNQYSVYVYFHNRIPEYDRLLNVKQFIAHE